MRALTHLRVEREVLELERFEEDAVDLAALGHVALAGARVALGGDAARLVLLPDQVLDVEVRVPERVQVDLVQLLTSTRTPTPTP